MRKLVIGASVSAMLFSATTVSAEILGNYHVGNWLIGAYSNDQTKQFTHCATSSVYASGITMLFAVNSTISMEYWVCASSVGINAGSCDTIGIHDR